MRCAAPVRAQDPCLHPRTDAGCRWRSDRRTPPARAPSSTLNTQEPANRAETGRRLAVPRASASSHQHQHNQTCGKRHARDPVQDRQRHRVRETIDGQVRRKGRFAMDMLSEIDAATATFPVAVPGGFRARSGRPLRSGLPGDVWYARPGRRPRLATEAFFNDCISMYSARNYLQAACLTSTTPHSTT